MSICIRRPWVARSAATCLTLALLGGITNAQSERMRHKPEILYAAWDNAISEYVSVQSTLESFGKVDELYRLNGPDDGRPLSVYRVLYGEEGARVRALRKLPALGATGFGAEVPDECQLDLTQRTDDVALAMQAADASQQTATEARAEFRKLNQKAESARAAEAAAQAALDSAIASESAAEASYLAAHEAAHVVQQKAGAALRALQQNPSRENFLALLRVTVELQQARRTEATAAGNLNTAQAATAKFRQEFGQQQANRREAERAAQEAGDAADKADALAAAAWQSAGDVVNASIVSAADAVAEQALSVADIFRKGAEAVGMPKQSFGDKLSREALARLNAIEWTVLDAAALAERDAQDAMAIAIAARALPPIPRLKDETEAEKLPQFRVIDQIDSAGMTLAVNGAVLASGMLGDPLKNAIFEVISIVQAECADGDCVPGSNNPYYTENGTSGENPLYEANADYQNLVMQNTMNQANQQMQTISNVLKTKHDTAKNAIGNIR